MTATDLSDSFMRRANLRGVSLAGAALKNISWEQTNLTDADLTALTWQEPI